MSSISLYAASCYPSSSKRNAAVRLIIIKRIRCTRYGGLMRRERKNNINIINTRRAGFLSLSLYLILSLSLSPLNSFKRPCRRFVFEDDARVICQTPRTAVSSHRDVVRHTSHDLLHRLRARARSPGNARRPHTARPPTVTSSRSCTPSADTSFRPYTVYPLLRRW